MSKRGERNIAVTALKDAVPYIRMFKHKVFLIKVGGAVFAEAESSKHMLEQIGILHEVGIRVVLVHGGGPQATRLAESLGVPSRFVAGRRVTDARSLEVTTMVLNGLVNTRILAACRDLGIPAVGMSGVDAGLIEASRRPPVALEDAGEQTVDYGYVGDIEKINSEVVAKQLEAGYLPVISPLSADCGGTLLNINADTVAAALATDLRAEKLIIATGAPGVLEDENDPQSLVSYMDLEGLVKMRKKGQLAGGMAPKAAAIEAAIRGGVGRVHVISHDVPDSLLLEVFTNEGTGTLVVANTATLSAAEQAADAAH